MQDKAIVQLGKLKLLEMGDKKPYELFIQNMFPKKDNYDMILAVFELKSEEEKLICTFEKVDIEKVNKRNFEKYAYRKGTSRGGDVTFTTNFGDIEKKFRTLINIQFKSVVKRLALTTFKEEFCIFNTVYQFLLQKENFETVKSELSAIYESLEKEQKKTSGLSFMFVINGEEKYLSDFEIIQQILCASGTEDKSEQYKVKSEGKNAVCSICLETKETLHGFASPFKYATVDKPGMVSGFFNQKSNWKNYPICTDCSIKFELGRSFISSNLSSYFYGNPFYMIPKVLISKDIKKLDNATKRIKEIYDNLTENKQKIKQREEYIWEMLAKENDYFNLNLLFYKEDPKTKAIKIKLMLEEIVPSRFKKLFVDIPEIINENELYKNALIENKVPTDLRFSFGVFKTFFNNDFYNLIQKVFMLNKFSEEMLYDKFMDAIRENYNKGYQPYQLILKAHLTLAYFRKLELIPTKLTIQMEKTEQDLTVSGTGFSREKINDFINNNPLFLDTDAKRGVFLLGVLVRHLLNVQSIELNGGTPFEKKLKGYQLNPDNLIAVYSAAVGKLRDYRNVQIYYFPTILLEYVDKYFLENTNDIKKMSVNESSFFFVAGTQLIKKLKNSDN